MCMLTFFQKFGWFCVTVTIEWKQLQETLFSILDIFHTLKFSIYIHDTNSQKEPKHTKLKFSPNPHNPAAILRKLHII